MCFVFTVTSLLTNIKNSYPVEHRGEPLHEFRPERADFRPKRADTKLGRGYFRSERVDLRPERTDF